MIRPNRIPTAAALVGAFAALLTIIAARPAVAAEPGSPEYEIEYGEEGWEFVSTDRRFSIHIASRLQFRFATPFETDPQTLDDFQKDGQTTFKVNRAQLKVGGNVFQPWLDYYWEYELSAGHLLDFRMMLQKYPWLSLKVGQWKTDYNRERVISSGRQQMVDRSMINKFFTLDRQQGVAVYGHLDGKGAADANYWVSVLTGMGRGASANDDEEMMVVGRLQWNPLGRAVPMEGSDTRHLEQPAVLLAVGGMTNRSPFTRFSQAGGGQLNGFEDGERGQYRVNQIVQETAFMHRGLSWQQEYHRKEIDDRVNGVTTELGGLYAQLGYFPHRLLRRCPAPLEVAFRHAAYDPDRNVEHDREFEYTLAFNWFFHRHLNKITTEVSVFDFEQHAGDANDGVRFRAQWDISL